MSSLSVSAPQNALRFSSVLPSSMKPIISLALVGLGQHLHPVLSPCFHEKESISCLRAMSGDQMLAVLTHRFVL